MKAQVAKKFNQPSIELWDKLIILRCRTLHLLIAPPTTLATNQIRDEHNENESAESSSNNDWYEVADATVFLAVRHCNKTIITHQYLHSSCIKATLMSTHTMHHFTAVFDVNMGSPLV